jgi:two-component system alkaline phosphatase synthesis response regulator PhoP
MNKKKILVVDDDADFVEMNKLVLEKNGYEVMVAYNGKECLEKIELKKPDLILLDVMMTRKDEGFEVSRDLRNSEQTKNIPILMITSINNEVPYTFEPDETWLPVDDFIEKPVEPEQLLDKVSKMLAFFEGARASFRTVQI